MDVCGIIAEYDPFHTGHAWQIAEIRRRLGPGCAVVCVLGGGWSQRGTPALLDKSVRARLALEGGADLVLELPLPWAIASAEGFARGGVALLRASGAVTHLCFGSEEGRLEPLERLAGCLDSPAYPPALRRHLAEGLSFPAARQKAVEELLGPEGALLRQPNNNLGVEYLRAAAGSGLTAMTVPRRGTGHGQPPAGGFASAGYLRGLLRRGEGKKAAPYLLPGTLEALGPMADIRLGERSALERLRRLEPEALAALPDCGEGLSNRLYRAIRQGGGLEDILQRAKTKRYPLSRLRRVLLYAWLGLTREDVPPAPLYLRPLGLNGRGRLLLREMKE
ncbi:MAG: nucleotidyltransferase family protein, partial [Oscillospiraceae bacterium]|nr:nucleotidyltransferase family protein [Oscillospiraceae bacterium]